MEEKREKRREKKGRGLHIFISSLFFLLFSLGF